MKIGRPQNFDSSGLSKRTCLTCAVSFGTSIGGILWSRTSGIVALAAGSRWTFCGAL